MTDAPGEDRAGMEPDGQATAAGLPDPVTPDLWEGAELPRDPSATFSRRVDRPRPDNPEADSGRDPAFPGGGDSGGAVSGAPRWTLAGLPGDGEEDEGPTQRGLPAAEPSLPSTPPPPPRSPDGEDANETVGLPKTLTLSAHYDGGAPTQAMPSVEPDAPCYQLRRMVGQGGMGEVWEAVQTSLDRPVAVKRIRRARLRAMFGADDRARAEAEFRQEALATAFLQHPNIVPVHDLGVDPSGAPLISMKLVKGEPWERLLRDDFAALPPADYFAKHLPILIDVAQAVAFAHDRGIIHRDLKPAQVMVGEFGETLLMDWGLAVYAGPARRLPSANAEAPPAPPADPAPPIARRLPAPRDASSPSGTPALMAPEQARPKADRVGPWTDVYLLGATLYYVLTGTYPHEAPTARAAIQKSLAGSVQPPKARAPSRLIPPELADLALRAMAFEPEQRLSSALAFLRELQDYLSGASRRRQAAELADKAAEALAGAGDGSYEKLEECLALLGRARALDPDDPRAAALRDRAVGAYAEAALAANDLTLARIQAARMEPGAGRDALFARVAAEEARARAQARQRRWAIAASAALLAVVVLGGALSWRRIARERDAAVESALQARRARGDSESLARFMISDLRPRLKELERLDLLDETARRALSHYLRQDTAAMAADERRAMANGLNALGELLLEQGDSAQALVAYRATLDVCAANDAVARAKGPWLFLEIEALLGVANTRARRGEVEEAVETAGDALRLAREFARVDPGDADGGQRQLFESLSLLSSAIASRGRFDEAAELAAEELKLARGFADQGSDPEWPHRLARALGDAADRESMAGRREAAMSLAQEAVERGRRREAEAPDDPRRAHDLLAALVAASEYAQLLGRPAEAYGFAEEALGRLREQAKSDPLNMSRQRDLAVALNKIGMACYDAGRVEEARERFAESVEAMRRLAELDPRNSDWRRDLSVSMDRLASALRRLKRSEEALELYREGLEWAKVASSLDPGGAHWLRDVAVGHEHVGLALAELGRREESLAAMEESLAAWRALDRLAPGAATSLEGLAYGLEKVATAKSKLGLKEEAIDLFSEAVARMEELERALPNESHGEAVGVLLCSKGIAQMETARYEEALETLEAAADRLRPAVERQPENLLWGGNLAHALEAIGTMRSGLGEREAAAKILREALAERRRSLDLAPDDYVRARAYAVSWGVLCTALSAGGDSAGALDAARDGRKAIARLAEIAPQAPDAPFLDKFFAAVEAQLLIDLGRPGEARPIVDELAEAAWSDPELYANAKAAGIEVPDELLPPPPEESAAEEAAPDAAPPGEGADE